MLTMMKTNERTRSPEKEEKKKEKEKTFFFLSHEHVLKQQRIQNREGYIDESAWERWLRRIARDETLMEERDRGKEDLTYLACSLLT